MRHGVKVLHSREPEVVREANLRSLQSASKTIWVPPTSPTLAPLHARPGFAHILLECSYLNPEPRDIEAHSVPTQLITPFSQQQSTASSSSSPISGSDRIFASSTASLKRAFASMQPGPRLPPPLGRTRPRSEVRPGVMFRGPRRTGRSCTTPPSPLAPLLQGPGPGSAMKLKRQVLKSPAPVAPSRAAASALSNSGSGSWGFGFALTGKMHRGGGLDTTRTEQSSDICAHPKNIELWVSDTSWECRTDKCRSHGMVLSRKL